MAASSVRETNSLLKCAGTRSLAPRLLSASPPSPSLSYLDTLALPHCRAIPRTVWKQEINEKRGREAPVDRVALSVSPSNPAPRPSPVPPRPLPCKSTRDMPRDTESSHINKRLSHRVAANRPDSQGVKPLPSCEIMTCVQCVFFFSSSPLSHSNMNQQVWYNYISCPIANVAPLRQHKRFPPFSRQLALLTGFCQLNGRFSVHFFHFPSHHRSCEFIVQSNGCRRDHLPLFESRRLVVASLRARDPLKKDHVQNANNLS